QVEAGGLAGAIGADQGMNAAAPHLEADALDGDEALEFLRQPARLQNDVVGQAHRFGGGRFSMKASIPARPSSWAKALEITPEATARSHCATSWQPAAAAAPCTRAMTGCGSALIDCIIRLHCANSFSIFGCSFSARISFRSCPAQKPFPAPASTTTRIFLSETKESKAV